MVPIDFQPVFMQDSMFFFPICKCAVCLDTDKNSNKKRRGSPSHNPSIPPLHLIQQQQPTPHLSPLFYPQFPFPSYIFYQTIKKQTHLLFAQQNLQLKQIEDMGGSQSKNLQIQSFKSSHPALQNAKLVTNKQTLTQFIQAKFTIQNNQYDQWHKLLGTGSTIVLSDYLLLPQTTNYKHDQGLCGSTGTLTNTYPNYPYTLEELIRQRQPQGKLFKESELWYVLYGLAVAKHDVQGRAKQLGDIKPENIFINQDGKLKVANQFSWPDEHPSFCKALDLNNANFNGLLAPQDVAQLQRGKLQNDDNVQSQIFAIGATIISAGILGNFSTVYNYRNKTFNTQAFKQLRKAWATSQRYSAIFKSIILNLVETNPGERLTSYELWSFVKQYEDKILDKTQFVILEVPKKIERTFAAFQSNSL